MPLHEQIASGVRAEIAAGNLEAGDRLPPARELAASLDVNVHTVLRGLQNLRDEGLLEVRRGRGTTVSDGAVDLVGVTDAARSFVARARRVALTDDNIRSILEDSL